MALSSGNKALWSDLSDLFSRISTQRQKFGLSAITPSNYGSAETKAYPAVVQNMKSLISDLTANTYASSVASHFTEITVPTTATLLYPTPLNKVNEIVTNLENTCVFNTAFFTSFFTSFFVSSFNASFNSFNSFNSSFNNFNSFDSFDSFSSGCFIFNGNFFYSTAGFSCQPYKNGM